MSGTAEVVIAIKLLKAFTADTKEIRKNQKELLDRIDLSIKATEDVKMMIGELTLTALRSALDSFQQALNSDIEEIRKHKLNEADRVFSKLTQLDDGQVTTGTSGNCDNRDLIILGHVGEYAYFKLNGDDRNAALQVYQCIAKCATGSAEKLPSTLNLFPNEFFSQDYNLLIATHLINCENAKSQLQPIQADIENAYSELRNLGWGGAIAGGITVFLPGLPLLAAIAYPVGTFHFVKDKASQILAIPQKRRLIAEWEKGRITLETELNAHGYALNKVYETLIAECLQRQSELEAEHPTQSISYVLCLQKLKSYIGDLEKQQLLDAQRNKLLTVKAQVQQLPFRFDSGRTYLPTLVAETDKIFSAFSEIFGDVSRAITLSSDLVENCKKLDNSWNALMAT